MISKTDANGNSVTCNYDEKDNLLTSTDALGNVTKYTYDSYGEELSCTDPLGHTTTYTYDDNGYRSSTTDADHNTTSSYCDPMGRELSSTDGLNQTTNYLVDNWNRRTEVTDPDNSTTTSTTYDAYDNVLTVTDPGTNVQYNTYDAENRLLTHKNGRNDLVQNQYDLPGQLGLLSRTEDGNGHITSFAYTPRNDIKTTYYPDNTSESVSYYPGGQKYQHTDGNGKTITYLYTTNDRLYEVQYPTGVNTFFYYDPANRRTKMTDSSGTTTWGYDNDNRVHQLSSPKSTETYYYDASGRRTQMTLAGKGSWYYHFYDSGLPYEVTNPANYTTSFVYDAADRLQTQTDGNGSVVTYGYNDLDQVTSQVTQQSTGPTLATDSYTYWPNGTVHTKADSDGSTTTYQYDGADQLTSEARTGPNAYSASYTYDGNSNRLTKTLNGALDTYHYDAGDKLLSTSAKSFTYDGDGNVQTVSSSGSTTTYNWDAEDRLTSIAGTSAVNVYNGLDQRIDRVGTSSTNFPYSYDGADPGDPVLCDGQDVYTPGLSQTAISTNGTSFYVLDRLGSSTRMLGPGQGVTDSQVFDAFGNTMAPRVGTTWPLSFGYGAKSNYQTDQDTGLMLLGHRFYDPTIGRFLSRDPVHDGVNDYAYVENNPVDAVDPTGEVMQATTNHNAISDFMNSGGDARDDSGSFELTKAATQVAPGTCGNSSNGGSEGAPNPTATSSTASEKSAAGNSGSSDPMTVTFNKPGGMGTITATIDNKLVLSAPAYNLTDKPNAKPNATGKDGPIPTGVYTLSGPFHFNTDRSRPAIMCNIKSRPDIHIHTTKNPKKFGWFPTQGCIRVKSDTLQSLISLVRDHPTTFIVFKGP